MLNTRLVIRTLGFLSLFLLAVVWSSVGFAQDSESASTSPFAGLRFREIGPASPAGRIDDSAVLESNSAVFLRRHGYRRFVEDRQSKHDLHNRVDNEATSSIGDVAIAPADANLVQ